MTITFLAQFFLCYSFQHCFVHLEFFFPHNSVFVCCPFGQNWINGLVAITLKEMAENGPRDTIKGHERRVVLFGRKINWIRLKMMVRLPLLESLGMWIAEFCIESLYFFKFSIVHHGTFIGCPMWIMSKCRCIFIAEWLLFCMSWNDFLFSFDSTRRWVRLLLPSLYLAQTQSFLFARTHTHIFFCSLPFARLRVLGSVSCLCLCAAK